MGKAGLSLHSIYQWQRQVWEKLSCSPRRRKILTAEASLLGNTTIKLFGQLKKENLIKPCNVQIKQGDFKTHQFVHGTGNVAIMIVEYRTVYLFLKGA